MEDQTEPLEKRRFVAPVLALIAGLLLIAYLNFRPSSVSNPRDQIQQVAPEDLVKMADSYDSGIFKGYVPGDDPQISIEDASGNTLVFSCVSGCPPLDEMPDRYVGKQVKIHWSSLGTWTDETGETSSPKTVVQVDLLSGE
jgi:hypothetical protein